jgi:catechol 2,3-dioxygenase-like lactoylglutathione lyase family enzyme
MESVAKLAKLAADIGIVVADLEAQRRFYGEVLGLPYAGVLPLPGGEVHVYPCGESLLKLYRMGEGAPADAALFGSRAGLAYLTLTLADVDGTFADLKAKGVTVLSEPGDFDGGVELAPPVGRMKARFALIADADGNMIELFEYRD